MSTPTPPSNPPATDPRVAADLAAVKSAAAKIRVEDNYDEQEELALDKSTLDPKMHYRWGHERSTRQAQLRGHKYKYRPVSRSKDGVKTVGDLLAGSTEDLIRNGDLILMCCLREEKAKRDVRQAALKRARLGTPVKQFESKASAGGVTVTTADRTSRKEPGE